LATCTEEKLDFCLVYLKPPVFNAILSRNMLTFYKEFLFALQNGSHQQIEDVIYEDPLNIFSLRGFITGTKI